MHCHSLATRELSIQELKLRCLSHQENWGDNVHGLAVSDVRVTVSIGWQDSPERSYADAAEFVSVTKKNRRNI